MHILILTGPAAAGKNTVANMVAQRKRNCAVIDVDLVRWMYSKPHKAPWEGEKGKRQQKIGVENTCLLAKNFIKNNVDVIILDVLQNDAAKLYKKLLHEYAPKIILLMPSFEEAHRRFISRPPTVTEDEFKLVYKWQEELMDYDKKIDNTKLSAEKTAIMLNDLR